MIHVLTVHHRTDKWVDTQLDALDRHLTEPYTTWAVLDGVRADRFDHVVTTDRTAHAPRLDLLAARCDAAPDDLLVFLDGDAFPIADPWPTITAGLERGVLVAVRRDEGSGGGWPHPSFCAVRARDWTDIDGTWAVDTWPDPTVKHRRDVGVKLLKRLGDRPWVPLLRTNTHNPHPLFFGVYGDVIYHHGAGFRTPTSSADGRATRGDRAAAKTRREDNQRLSDEFHAAAVTDPDFWRCLCE